MLESEIKEGSLLQTTEIRRSRKEYWAILCQQIKWTNFWKETTKMYKLSIVDNLGGSGGFLMLVGQKKNLNVI